MTEEQAKRKHRCLLGLWVKPADHAAFSKEAQAHGMDISSLLRLRVFGKTHGLRITRRPSADMMLLGNLIGALSAISGELNKNGSNINQIARHLNHGGNDVFGLDGALKRLESVQDNLLNALSEVEAAIVGRQKTRLDITP